MRPNTSLGAIKVAVADGVLTFLWGFFAHRRWALTFVVASALGVAQGLPTLFITTVLVFILLFLFSIIGDVLGGATFNPTAIAAFYAAGIGGPDSLVSAALRFPTQAAGAVGGALAIMEVMPIQYKHMLGGPSLKVDLHTGAIAEGVLTFTITFLPSFSSSLGSKQPTYEELVACQVNCFASCCRFKLYWTFYESCQCIRVGVCT